MNKDEFIQELEKKLKKLPTEERKTAIIYYQEYFEEAGQGNEEKIIEEIGSPAEIASQIMRNFIVKETTSSEEEKNVKRSFTTIWIVILAILASPIALPIALTIIILILTAWIVIISFCIIGFALVLGGIIYSIVSIFVLFEDIQLAIFIMGFGLLALGSGIAITRGASNLFIKYSSWITARISKILLKKEKSNEK